MGTYYNFEKVEAEGRRLQPFQLANYPRQPILHRLVAVCDRLIFKQAVDVTDSEEYVLFYNQYRAGYLISFDLYDYDPSIEDKP
jgi:hypothetical protein